MLFPLERLECSGCGRTRLVPLSLLRPAIWAVLLVFVVLGIRHMLPGGAGQPASSLTGLQPALLQPTPGAAEVDQADDLAAAVVDTQDPATLFLGESGETVYQAPLDSRQDMFPADAAWPDQPESTQSADHDIYAPIMQADSGNFTIQVASAGTWAEADKMMVLLSRRYQLKDEFFVYRSQAGGKLLFPVLYGSFNSSRQAEAAINGLPDHLKAGQPFVRKFATVQRMLADASG